MPKSVSGLAFHADSSYNTLAKDRILESFLNKSVTLKTGVDPVNTDHILHRAVGEKIGSQVENRTFSDVGNLLRKTAVIFLPACDSVNVAHPIQNIIVIKTLGDPIHKLFGVDGNEVADSNECALTAGEIDHFKVYLLEFFGRCIGEKRTFGIIGNCRPVVVAVVSAVFQKNYSILVAILKGRLHYFKALLNGSSHFAVVFHLDAVVLEFVKAIAEKLVTLQLLVIHNALKYRVAVYLDLFQIQSFLPSLFG